MTKLFSCFVFLFSLGAMGQVSVYVFPQRQQIAVNGIQTFTAVVTGADDKAVTWAASCGEIIKGLNSTIGLKSGAQQSCTVIATSAADKGKSATGIVTYVATPHFQEGVHPRLLLTPAMVETMRAGGWGTNANPYWRNGLAKTAANAVAEVDAKWCFSFGGHCPQGAKAGEPEHFFEGTLYGPPPVTSLVRDASGVVTVTTASAFNVWKGATVRVVPAAVDQGSFKKAAVVVNSVIDATHFTYKDSGAAVSSTAPATLSVGCSARVNSNTWCDTGGYKTPIFDATETYAELFAFLSLIEPDAKQQERYRIRAHDMMMWMIRLAENTTAETCKPGGHFFPFQNCAFSIGDRAHQAGMEAFPLTVDWIYSSFTPAERRSITKVFRWWSHMAITAGPTGVLYPVPFGVMNDTALLSKTKQLRWQMNNLGNSQYRSVMMMGLVMDAADDPADDGANRRAVSPQKEGLKANALQAYAALAQGAWTYIHWAVAEDPGVVAAVLGTSPKGLGEAQGGLSPEGVEYGDNYGYVAMALLALHTAGADDPTHMPQMSFLASSHWDLWVDGLLNILSPVPRTDNFGSHYETTSFGDNGNGNQISTDYIKILMPLGLYDYYTRTNSARLNAIRWMAKQGLDGGCGSGKDGACGGAGGSQFLYRRLISTVGSNNFNMPIYTFLLLDPAATPNSPTNPSGDVDPRPKYPTEFYAAGHHEMSSRTDWGPHASWMITHCSWIQIDHQRGNCGQTEFYRKGKWVTKAHGTYTSVVGGLSIFGNAGISIGNPNTDPSKADYYSIIASHGAQYDQRGAGGFTPTPLFSSGAEFVHEYFDQTEEYNNNLPNHFPTSDVLHASRSVVWVKPDIVVFYDRGVSRSAGMFKRDNFNFTSEPKVNGQVATVPEGYLTTLLPLAQNFSASVCAYGSAVGDCAGGDKSKASDESAFLYQVTDTSVPMSAQFLHVLEGADEGASRTVPTLVQAKRTAMDGAIVGNSVVLFARVPLSAKFESSSYSVPASVVNHYISGLQPNTKYGVEGGGGSYTISGRCGSNCVTTDGAGLLRFTR